MYGGGGHKFSLGWQHFPLEWMGSQYILSSGSYGKQQLTIEHYLHICIRVLRLTDSHLPPNLTSTAITKCTTNHKFRLEVTQKMENVWFLMHGLLLIFFTQMHISRNSLTTSQVKTISCCQLRLLSGQGQIFKYSFAAIRSTINNRVCSSLRIYPIQ